MKRIAAFVLALAVMSAPGLEAQTITGKVTLSGKVQFGSTSASGGVPSEFTDIFYYQLGRLNTFYTGTIQASWDGLVRQPACRAAELSPADALGIQAAGYYAAHVTPFLDRLQDMGINCVKVQIGFPHLYQPYHDWLWNGAGCAYNSSGGTQCAAAYATAHWNAETAFWQQVRSDTTARSMQLIVQAAVQGSAGSEINNASLAYYYDTLNFASYKTGRATNAVNVMTYAAPDYINVMSEPTHEYSQAVKSDGTSAIPELWPSPANCAVPGNVATCALEANIQDLANTITTALEAIPINHTTTKVAVGIALGVYDGPNIVALEAALSHVDLLDGHLHAVTNTGANDSLALLSSMANAAFAAGKGFGMNEESLDKNRPGSPGPTPQEQGVMDPLVYYGRQWYSFWNPSTNPTESVDAAFIRVLVAFASWKGAAGTVHYYSYSEPYEFFNTLDYYNVSGCPPPSTSCSGPTYTSMNTAAATAKIEGGAATTSILTNVGNYYKSALAITTGNPWTL